MRMLAEILLFLALGWAPPAFAQEGSSSPHASAVASSPGQSRLPADLPLRRDSEPASAIPAGYGAWLLVLVLALGGLLALRQARRGKGRWLAGLRGTDAGGAPKVLAVKLLGAHASLQVVEWNGKEILLGCSPQAVTVLDSRPSTTDRLSAPAAAERRQPYQEAPP